MTSSTSSNAATEDLPADQLPTRSLFEEIYNELADFEMVADGTEGFQLDLGVCADLLNR